jgi:ArsR family transcriptional regulator
MVDIDRVALALSDPMRLAILDRLALGRRGACCSPENAELPGAVCSCDLLIPLGLQASRLSYHLKELRKAGLVSERKKGRWVYYSLEPETLRAFALALGERFSLSMEGAGPGG